MSKVQVPTGIIAKGAHTRPINRQASQSVRGGETWSPRINDNRVVYDTAPPMRHPNDAQSQFIGRVYGRLTVVGVAKEQNPKKNALYVFRCSCGLWQQGRVQALAKGTVDRCARCELVEKMRNGQRKTYYVNLAKLKEKPE